MIAIGAPVGEYVPLAAEYLHTELIIPPHADVANAVGAVVGGVVQQVRANIYPSLGGDHVRLHLPDGVCDFATVAEAVAYAEQSLPGVVEDMARRAGAGQVEVRMGRVDVTAPVGEDYGQEVYLETQLTFTAAGRPSLTR